MCEAEKRWLEAKSKEWEAEVLIAKLIEYENQ